MITQPEHLIIVRGAGEMASGVIHRLFTEGYWVIALEQPDPTCVRRLVCFAEAVFDSETKVENVTAKLVMTEDLINDFAGNYVPLVIDPEGKLISSLKPAVLIDARMLKRANDCSADMAPIVIGLGPGFSAGRNSHAVIETNRGPDLGKLILNGEAEPHTGIPATVQGVGAERVLRAPGTGVFHSSVRIADSITAGTIIGRVGSTELSAPISGVVRGLLRNGNNVTNGQKIGDIDPRNDPELCAVISDKAKAIAQGVIEALTAFNFSRQ